MLNNPYTAPTAELAETADAAVEIPKGIARKIKNGWMAGLISAALTCLFAVLALLGIGLLGINSLAFIDAAVIAGLSYGVYRNSRVCAVLLFLFFALNKALMWRQSGTVSGLPLAIVFFWYFGQGIVGTIQLHRLKNQG